MERELTDLRTTSEKLFNEGRYAKDGRTLDKQKFDDQLKDWKQEKAGYEARIKNLEDANNNLLKAFEGEKNNSAILAEQLREGLPGAFRESSPDGDARELKRQVKRYRHELGHRNEELARLRAENHSMKLASFQSASDMLQHCSHLVDTRTTLYETMVAMAEYADGISGTVPTGAQLAEASIFEDYLEARAEALQEAIAAPSRSSVLEDFDDNWKSMLDRYDWGALCRLHIAVGKAARLMESAQDPAEYLGAVDEMNRCAMAAEEAQGDEFQSGAGVLVKEINDRVDEIRYRHGE